MQTVPTIQPGVGTASGQASPLAGSDDGAFPATLRQVLSPAHGNGSPSAGGNTAPAAADQPATAAPQQHAVSSADVATTLLPHAVRSLAVDPPHAAATPATAVNPPSPLPTPASEAVPVPQNGADAAPPPEAGAAPAADAPADTAPQISGALQDIAAARRVANPRVAVSVDAKPARTAPAGAAPAAQAEAVAHRLAADDESLAAPATAKAQRADDAHRDPADPAAPLTDPAGTPPALVALPQTLATPPRVPVTSPQALAAQQPASVAAAATPPGRGSVTAGAGVDRPAILPDGTSTETADTGPVRVGLPPTDGPPATPAKVVGAPAASMPAAAVPGAAAEVSAATLSASTLAASTLGTPAAVATGPAATATSGRVPDVAIDAPPGSPQFGPQIGERLLWLVRDGIHEARLQLNPRELGPVEVRLSVGDGAAQLSFSAQHAGTAAAVQQSLPQLRDLLAQQGLQLGQASVFHQPAGDGAAGGQQQAQHSGAPWAPAGDGGLAFDDGLAAPAARVIGRGLVDAYA